jgi:molybdopterin converting factor small subunit
MHVEIALYATLAKYLPSGSQQRKAVITARAGATAREIMLQLGIPQEYPNILQVNGKQANPDTVLKEGDTLAVFPPLAGGRGDLYL